MRSQKEYITFVLRGLQEDIKNPLKNTKAGTILGGEAFVKRITERYLDRDLTDRDLPAARELKRIGIGDLKQIIGKHLSDRLESRLKVELYIVRKHSGLTLREICVEYGKEISAVSQMIRRFEIGLSSKQKLNKIINKIEADIKKMSYV